MNESFLHHSTSGMMTPDVGMVFPHNCHNIPTSTRSRLFVLCSGGPWEAFCKIYHRWVMTNAKIPPPLSRMLLGAPEGAFAHSHLCSLCLSLGDAHPLTQQVFIEHLLEACILVGASILARDAAAAAAKSLRCPTLCNPIDNSPPGSPIPGILQARTRMGCHFLLPCMKVKSGSEGTQSCPTLSDPIDCSLPDSSVHGIFQARVLEWVAIAFSLKGTRTLQPTFKGGRI